MPDGHSHFIILFDHYLYRSPSTSHVQDALWHDCMECHVHWVSRTSESWSDIRANPARGSETLCVVLPFVFCTSYQQPWNEPQLLALSKLQSVVMLIWAQRDTIHSLPLISSFPKGSLDPLAIRIVLKEMGAMGQRTFGKGQLWKALLYQGHGGGLWFQSQPSQATGCF